MNIRQHLREWSYRAAARRFVTSRSRRPGDGVDDRSSREPKSEDRLRDSAIIASIWELSAELKGDPSVDHVTSLTARGHDSRIIRRTLSWSAAAAASVIGLGIYVFLTASDQVSYSTGIGEQKTIVLADGSSLFLNTASAVRVDYRALRRVVWLQAGEATFDVAKSRLRPFDVITPVGSATAVGTRFDVLSRPAAMEVTMLEGVVSVGPAKSGTSATRTLIHAGELAVVRPGMVVSVSTADLAGFVGHRVQRLDFDNVRLSDALTEFNRYNNKPIRAQTDSIAARRMSGVFHVGDAAALAASLAASLQLHTVDEGSAIVLAADADAE